MTRLMITASFLALAACGGGAKATDAICSEMIAGDAETAESMAEDGVTPEAMCACVGATIDAMPDGEKAKNVGVMLAVTAIRQADNVGVEDAAEKLEEQLRSGSGGHAFTENDFNNVGRLLNRVGNQLEDGGSCAAG